MATISYLGNVSGPFSSSVKYLGSAKPTGESTPKDWSFIQRGGDLILRSIDEVTPPDFSIVNGNLILTYPDGSTPPDVHINESGYLILTTEDL